MDEQLKRALLQAWKAIYKQKKWLVIALVIGLCVGFLASLKIEQKYSSSQTISLQDEQTFNSLLKGVSAPLNTKKTTRTAYSVITTEPVLHRVAIRAQLLDSNSSEGARMSAIQDIRKRIEIQTAYSESEIVTISYFANKPELAKSMVEIISEEYINEVLKIRAKTARLAIDFLNKQILKTQKDLELEENKLENLKQKYMHVIPDLFINKKDNLEDIDAKLFEAKVKYQEVKKRIAFIQETLGSYNSEIEKLKTQRNALELELNRELSVKTDRHPDVIKIQWDLQKVIQDIQLMKKKPQSKYMSPEVGMKVNSKAEVEFETESTDVFYVTRKILQSELELEEEMLRAKIAEFEKQILSKEKILKERPSVERELKVISSKTSILVRKVKDLKSKHDAATNSLNIAIMDAKSGHSIVSPANTPLYSKAPKASMVIFLVMFLALIITAVIIGLVDYLKNKVVSKEDVIELLEINCIGEFQNFSVIHQGEQK